MDLDVNADGGKYVQQAEFKLKSISTALRLKKTDDNIEEIRHYSSELQVLVDLNIMSFCRLHFFKIV